MAQILSLATDEERVRNSLARAFQSAHTNFLLGSGASVPAIPIAGAVEQEIATLFAEGQDEAANRRLAAFLRSVQEPTNELIQRAARPDNEATIANYVELLKFLDTMLSERRTRLLPTHTTIFTTNYDLFVEAACSRHAGVILNDGFNRGPALDGRVEYSSASFFTTVYNVGNVYQYRVEVPCINLIKLHGSLSWLKTGELVTCSFATRVVPTADADAADVEQFIRDTAVVLPQATKHRTSVMEQTYYDLFRIYANELDKENSLLVAFGFSFSDEHILHVTRRALRNPTMLLVVFAFDAPAVQSLAGKFNAHNNVAIVTNGDDPLTFQAFNAVLSRSVPASRPR
jgi:hypothetical protein